MINTIHITSHRYDWDDYLIALCMDSGEDVIIVEDDKGMEVATCKDCIEMWEAEHGVINGRA